MASLFRTSAPLSLFGMCLSLCGFAGALPSYCAALRRSRLRKLAISAFGGALAACLAALRSHWATNRLRDMATLCCHVWYSGLVVLLMHEFIFSERFCLPRWLCWRLALFRRSLCFVRLTVLPPLGFCRLRVRFRSVRRLRLLLAVARRIFAALPWSRRCARRCTSGFSPRCLQLQLRPPLRVGVFAVLPWSCRCARRCTSGFSLRCQELPLRSPLHFEFFAALPWSCRCTCSCCFGFLRCAAAGFCASAADIGALCLAASVFPLRVLMAGVVA